eukprot:GHVS01023318.1.p1 GENE.GHVS01023318.1~~GHVS01023318.1.p1  ORF type:complete len:162 (-),score=16.37 GHVS01023318.1:764-1249(-)
MQEPLVVNRCPTSWLVDTGAAVSVVWADEAARLISTGRRMKLVGIGHEVAVQAKPVLLRWKGRRCLVRPVIVNQLVYPGLLGLDAMRKLGMVIRPAKREVAIYVVDQTLEECAEGCERAQPMANIIDVDPKILFDRTSDTIAKAGNIIIYTSGCPNSQNRC